ncbi:RNA polymerase sigma-70 factor [Pedobacter caeni]|uniref:RNA polymerase sigma-70 factor, ECF subfamily n=1 Tax=Pedobacter caeni TaxID=288992 RepID=A0A1M5J3I6_9SPHI|nr:RNA polymerase sigma-70 factor [Pedobacter caeni]SHG35146.1 RNA polymerase sigma-70 factor, ECF subfamily [Pedobacter caeni]
MKNKNGSFQDENKIVQLNEEQFTLLFNQHWKKLFAFCRFHTEDTERARGMVQDIFCSLWDRRHQQDMVTNMRSYLFGAAKLKIANYFRDKYLHEQHLKSISKLHCETVHNTEETILFEDLNDFVNSLVSKLPSKCREVYQLSRNSQLSIPEIAIRLNIAEKTVEAHLNKALKSLRTSLKVVNN